MKMITLVLSLISFFFVFLGIFWVNWNKGKNFFKNREKSSPFECGFDPKKKSRLPFSLRFFLLLLFFLIFDMEMILLFQVPILLKEYFFKMSLFMMNFIWMLFLGFKEEWRRGALKWKK